MKNILIIAVTRIGDTLFTSPAIKAISECYPDAAITVLGHPARYQVLKYLPFIAHVGSITKKTALWLGWFGRRMQWSRTSASWPRMRSVKYDLAFVYGFDRALIRYALRISRKTIAFRQSDDRINERLYKVVEMPSFRSMHSIDQSLQLPRAVNPALRLENRRIQFALSPLERAWAQQRVLRIRKSNTLLVGLQIASFHTKAYRDWPVESFHQFCVQMLKEHTGVHFFIFGGKAEQDRTHWLKQQLMNHATLLAGKLTLRETGAVMAELDLFVGVDTGPTHIMSTFDIPMVVLFPSVHVTQNVGALDHPCYFPVHPADPDCDERCSMPGLSVRDVMDTVRVALGT